MSGSRGRRSLRACFEYLFEQLLHIALFFAEGETDSKLRGACFEFLFEQLLHIAFFFFVEGEADSKLRRACFDFRFEHPLHAALLVLGETDSKLRTHGMTFVRHCTRKEGEKKGASAFEIGSRRRRAIESESRRHRRMITSPAIMTLRCEGSAAPE